jgi:hypothetical protein
MPVHRCCPPTAVSSLRMSFSYTVRPPGNLELAEQPRSFATDGVGELRRCCSNLPRFTPPAPVRMRPLSPPSPVNPLPSMTLSSLHMTRDEASQLIAGSVGRLGTYFFE